MYDTILNDTISRFRRKDFAHGTVGELTRSSFASSDSELSQPNTRPHSRQIEIKGKPQPSRYVERNPRWEPILVDALRIRNGRGDRLIRNRFHVLSLRYRPRGDEYWIYTYSKCV